jgi:serine protease Do
MIRTSLFLIFLFLSSNALAFEQIVPADQKQIQLSFAPIVKQVAPAVVNIYTKKTVTRRASPFFGDPFFDQFFGESFGFGGGYTRQRLESALGSGVIIDEKGLVITNEHVVRQAEEITVVLPDGREFEAHKLLEDEPSDLALLKIEPGDEELPFVNLKPSESLEVGDLVLAIGNPFGVGQTVTSGIVSALARTSLDISDFNFFIQTDAAINPGNSGGALVAMDGGVVGINTAIYSKGGGSMGLGFSIPSEMVATLVAAVETGQVNKKGVVRPWLGVSAQKLTKDIADSLSLDIVSGAMIADLHSASPARKAGLKVGDIVVSVNGKVVKDPAEMKFRMATVPLGTEAEFELYRDGKQRSLKVKAIAPPEKPARNETELVGAHPFSGSIIANVNPAVSYELGLNEEEGVVVIEVMPRTRATRLVREGDIIVSINDIEIEKVKDMQKILKRGNRYGWEIILYRNGNLRQIVMR